MSFPLPDVTPLNAPHWNGLKQGRLMFQRCRACGHAWLPAREACPQCLAVEPEWQESAGRGAVVSWVVYHTAYDAAFKDRLPYDVTCVALDEGPRILTNVIDSDAGAKLRIGARVSLCIEHEGELALARFRLAGAG
ncbi:MAG: Zn-ribbon domain-containing OB-fold protein [Phreatobacter sp.]|uniref:Zn-ribbon domain-containing OB-fold protein n=1 Tax=Phreatobacter sp. TaxID=1966341 RepID=UPI001A50B4C3|nr:Zn-ribbon domain-containing OB-fold protein [Phreatobacter sp.]MBL8570716.1 Zn-ribbon domain-containing OB-fold protein [Phreatobacter sp.]